MSNSIMFRKQEGHDGPVSLVCTIALRERDLEMIEANILTKIHDDFINNKDNVACLMDHEYIVKVKYEWMHSRSC